MSWDQGPTDRVDSLKFLSLCKQFERCGKLSGGNKKLRSLFSSELRDHCKGQSLFPLMRLVVPSIDRERTYGLKESAIGRLYIECLGIDGSSDALKIKKYRNKSRSGGQFDTILHDVLKSRTGSGGTLQIGDINKRLDGLCSSEPGAKNAVITQCLHDMSALEHKWFSKIIRKDMSLGFQVGTVLDFFQKGLHLFYNTCTDLRQVCAIMKDPVKLNNLKPVISISSRLSPMLAANKDIQTCLIPFVGKDVVLEPKFDGERILIHKDGDDVKFFTRQSVDYTQHYGFFKHYVCKNVHCSKAILDGEMLVWDEVGERFAKFGENRTVAQMMAIRQNADGTLQDSDKWLCYMAFDVLFMEGGPPGLPEGDLLNIPLGRRKDVLRSIITPEAKKLDIVNGVTITSRNEIERNGIAEMTFDKLLLDGMEGLMVKDLTSKYSLGSKSRNKGAWVKVKPYLGNINDTLDLIVLGGYYGKGQRRSGGISHFLLGVADTSGMKEEDEYPTRFLTFCKVGTGYTLPELESVRAKLHPYWLKYVREKSPPHLSGWQPGKTDDVPDVYILPENSIIFELKGQEITDTDQFNARLCLRFPTVQHIRMDKAWHECMTMDQLRELNTQCALNSSRRNVGAQAGSRRKGQALVTDATGRGEGKALQQISRKAGRRVMTQHQNIDQSKIEKTGTLFKGLNLYVIPGTATIGQMEYSKPQIQTMIAEQSGGLHANILKNTNFIIAPTEKHNLVRTMRESNRDVYTTDWLLRCVAAGRILTPQFHDLLSKSEKSKEALAMSADVFGDSFSDEVTPHQLKNVFDRVRHFKERNDEPSEIDLDDTEVEAIFDNVLFNQLSKYVFYFDVFEDVGLNEEFPMRQSDVNDLIVASHQVRLYAAAISNVLTEEVTHIIYHTKKSKPLQRALRRLKKEGITWQVAEKEFIHQEIKKLKEDI